MGKYRSNSNKKTFQSDEYMGEENEKTIRIGFDYSHNNKLTIESPSFSDFTDFLFRSGFNIGMIKNGIEIEKLELYKVFIIGSPFGEDFSEMEIKAIEQYVKNGGSLLVISDSGGDTENETNSNEITETFGFTFNPDIICDSLNYVKNQEQVIISNLEIHPITQEVNRIVHSSGCSISVDETFESDKNISLQILAKGGLNTFVKSFNGEKYIELDAPNFPIFIAVNYYDGRVVGLGNTSIFSSLSSNYGFNALDNNVLIANTINWLISTDETEENRSDSKILSLNLNRSLLLWIENLVKRKKWKNSSDIINFAVKYLKDSYADILKETKQKRQKLKQLRRKRTIQKNKRSLQKEEERKVAIKEAEEMIYDLIQEESIEERNEGDKKNLDSILKDLEKIDKNE